MANNMELLDYTDLTFAEMVDKILEKDEEIKTLEKEITELNEKDEEAQKEIKELEERIEELEEGEDE